MTITVAQADDLNGLCQYDKHISQNELAYSISRKRVYIIRKRGRLIGWLRYNLFWDNTPFLNMIFLLDGFRGKGFGRQLVNYWEEEMEKLGYGTVMTSTASNEYVQHFYQALDYQPVGGFIYRSDPYEMILMKDI